MKKIITTLASVFIAVIVMAQVSESINYQAVARNNSGQALANQTIKVRFTISRDAVTQYSETRQVTTNALGLFNVQIGSAGAISTTGTFNAIDWTNNTPNMFLKVELDINNSGVFTDMGAQSFSSVPFALASKKAFEAENTVNIAGRPIDQTSTPTVGSRLSWNGTSWTPVKKDTVFGFSSGGSTIIAGGSNSPFAFCHSSPINITVTGGERIVASMGTALGHTSTTNQVTASYAICYQSYEPGSPIVAFYPLNYPDVNVPPITSSNNRTAIFAVGAITLPPGQYKIGLGIKNSSNSINLSNNASVNGTVEIRY